jgi:hypothetical protein
MSDFYTKNDHFYQDRLGTNVQKSSGNQKTDGFWDENGFVQQEDESVRPLKGASCGKSFSHPLHLFSKQRIEKNDTWPILNIWFNSICFNSTYNSVWNWCVCVCLHSCLLSFVCVFACVLLLWLCVCVCVCVCAACVATGRERAAWGGAGMHGWGGHEAHEAPGAYAHAISAISCCIYIIYRYCINV